MGKTFADLDDMLSKSSIATLVLPALANTLFGTAEDGNKVVADANLRAEALSEFIYSDLCGVRPDA